MCRVSRSGPRQLSLCGPHRPRLVSSVGLLWCHWPLQLPQFYFPLRDNIRGKKKVMTTNWFDGFLLKIASNDGSEEIYLLMRVEIFPLANFWGHGPRTSSESTHQILSRLEFSLDWLANSFLSRDPEICFNNPCKLFWCMLRFENLSVAKIEYQGANHEIPPYSPKTNLKNYNWIMHYSTLSIRYCIYPVYKTLPTLAKWPLWD